jgi:hypothetical protein
MLWVTLKEVGRIKFVRAKDPLRQPASKRKRVPGERWLNPCVGCLVSDGHCFEDQGSVGT